MVSVTKAKSQEKSRAEAAEEAADRSWPRPRWRTPRRPEVFPVFSDDTARAGPSQVRSVMPRRYQWIVPGKGGDKIRYPWWWEQQQGRNRPSHGEEKHLWAPNVMEPGPRDPTLLWMGSSDHFSTPYPTPGSSAWGGVASVTEQQREQAGWDPRTRGMRGDASFSSSEKENATRM